MFKSVCLVTFLVYFASAERISNVESPTWQRRTTEDYSYLPSGGDRASSYDREDSGSRGSSWGSSGSVTSRPGRPTYSWERDSATTAGRVSYLDRFTTASPYGSGRDRDYDTGRYSGVSSRRPSYQTDRWGDVIGGDETTRRSSFDRESAWDSRTTTSRWVSRDTTRYSSGWESGSSGRGSSYNREEAYLRIQVELIKLTNEKGLTIEGSKCDTFGSCDPVVYAYIDTDRPNADFPGSRDSKYWPKVFEIDDKNTIDFRNANLSRDVCGLPYRDAKLRVLVEDKDSVSANDVIAKFDCPIVSEPDTSETFSKWQSGTCTSSTPTAPKAVTLTVRYKIFSVPRIRCDPDSGAVRVVGGTTAKPQTTRHR
jgi:hypothetical protein